MMNRIWNDESGVLTFEWILLITLLVIGIVGGLAVIRDAYIIEAAETAEAMIALNQGYVIKAPVDATIANTEAGVELTDYEASGAQGSLYEDQASDVNVTAPGSAYEGGGSADEETDVDG
ncbi:MAG: hypothetical protein IJF17_05060 [Thermoguttaceae bacterium]|nr:hypothetical protein [Thermoguttaceae bacterium]